MNKPGLALLWVLSMVVCTWVGYQIGSSTQGVSGDAQTAVGQQAHDAKSAFGGKASEGNESDGKNHVAVENNPFTQQPAAPANLDTGNLANDEEGSREQFSDNIQGEKGQRLEQLGKAFNQAQQQTLDHNALRENFENQFDEHDRDLEAQTHLTDFLLLHDDAHLIELHKIACTSGECQLLGQYDGDHQQWSTIIEQMQQQDWWQYRGTSSSSSSHDGVTYFNLYIDKGSDQE